MQVANRVFHLVFICILFFGCIDEDRFTVAKNSDETDVYDEIQNETENEFEIILSETESNGSTTRVEKWRVYENGAIINPADDAPKIACFTPKTIYFEFPEDMDSDYENIFIENHWDGLTEINLAYNVGNRQVFYNKRTRVAFQLDTERTVRIGVDADAYINNSTLWAYLLKRTESPLIPGVIIILPAGRTTIWISWVDQLCDGYVIVN